MISDIAHIVSYVLIDVPVLILDKMEFRVCDSQGTVPPRFPFKKTCCQGK